MGETWIFLEKWSSCSSFHVNLFYSWLDIVQIEKSVYDWDIEHTRENKRVKTTKVNPWPKCILNDFVCCSMKSIWLRVFSPQFKDFLWNSGLRVVFLIPFARLNHDHIHVHILYFQSFSVMFITHYPIHVTQRHHANTNTNANIIGPNILTETYTFYACILGVVCSSSLSSVSNLT